MIVLDLNTLLHHRNFLDLMFRWIDMNANDVLVVIPRHVMAELDDLKKRVADAQQAGHFVFNALHTFNVKREILWLDPDWVCAYEFVMIAYMVFKIISMTTTRLAEMKCTILQK